MYKYICIFAVIKSDIARYKIKINISKPRQHIELSELFHRYVGSELSFSAQSCF